MTARRIAVVCPAGRRRAIGPLLDAYRHRYAVTVHITGDRSVPQPSGIADLAGAADAILVIGWRARAPRTVLDAPTVTTEDGRVVPVGWVPDVGADGIRNFSETAALVHRRARASSTRTTAILGARAARYEDLASRIERLLTSADPDAAHRWTAQELTMEDALAGVGAGPAVVCYVGHGRPVGWAGYRGVRASHLAGVGRPSAIVLSFTCLTASRRRVGLSFAEQLVVQGSTAACLGAVVPTDHQWNGRWAYRMCRELATAETVGDVVVAAQPTVGASPYRLVGDPLAPLLDAADARAEMVRHSARHRALAAACELARPESSIREENIA